MDACTVADGQFHCSRLCEPTGWNTVTSDDLSGKANLGMGLASPGSNISGASTWGPKQSRGQPVQELEREFGVDSESQRFSTVGSNDEFPTGSRSVCIKNKRTSSTFCVLEARLNGVESRCVRNSMAINKGICVSTLLPDKPSVTKDRRGGSSAHAHNSTCLENSSMVPKFVKNASSQTDSVINNSQCSSSSSVRGNTSSQVNVPSRMACVSRHLSEKGIPREAAELILASWRSGTEQQYTGAWKQWVRWCGQRKINPLSASIGDVSLYLTTLYNSGLSYSTVNTYRSAISMTHLPIEGIAVGNHYLIKRLMKGIFNKRPPVPRYVLTWPVEVMLRYLKNIPQNDQLSLKLLSWKTAILVALVSADRGDAISALNTKFMTKDSTGYHFLVCKPTKSSRPGRGIKQIDLPKFVKDRRICVVLCLEAYLKATKEVRSDTQLFLSYVKPHKPVTRASIARWIKSIMQKAGIDVTMFRPHSTRSASTSAAFQQGVSVPDILKKADWASATVFHRYYNRPRVHTDFAQAILSMK